MWLYTQTYQGCGDPGRSRRDVSNTTSPGVPGDFHDVENHDDDDDDEDDDDETKSVFSLVNVQIAGAIVNLNKICIS